MVIGCPRGLVWDIAVEISAGVRPGEILAGKYRVERVLGWGGMGVVVAAHHLELDQRVALKFLSPQALASAEIVARFAREARAAVRIKSEHVARVTDVGQLANGSPFMVMEYLDGVDLSGWLAQKGTLPAEQAVDFVLQACEALAEAHALGIVHRDVKPANLFCIRGADGNLSIKVLDFGISKITSPGADSNSSDMTGTTVIVGSPFYMSPEQMFSSRGVDARTDIWSLGVVLFELLTGRAPFLSESMTELVAKVVTEPAPMLTSLRLDAPPELERVIARCLEKDRALRFESIADLAVALGELGSKRSRVSVERVLDTMREAGLSTAVLPPSGFHRTSRVPTSLIPGRGTMLQWNETTGGRAPEAGRPRRQGRRRPRSGRRRRRGRSAPGVPEVRRRVARGGRVLGGHREPASAPRVGVGRDRPDPFPAPGARRGRRAASERAARARGADRSPDPGRSSGDQAVGLVGPAGRQGELRPALLLRCEGKPSLQEGVLMRTFVRAVMVVSFVSLVAGSAQADITKDQCIDANARGQLLRHDGKLSAGRTLLQACASASCPTMVRDDCARRLDELEKAQPSIVFEVKDGGGGDVIDLRVSMDGELLSEHLDGTPLLVEPGVHVFSFEVAGLPTVTDRLLVREGEAGRREHVSVAGGAPPAPPAPVAPVAARPPPLTPVAQAPAHGLGAQKTVGLGVGAAGVVGPRRRGRLRGARELGVGQRQDRVRREHERMRRHDERRLAPCRRGHRRHARHGGAHRGRRAAGGGRGPLLHRARGGRTTARGVARAHLGTRPGRTFRDRRLLMGTWARHAASVVVLLAASFSLGGCTTVIGVGDITGVDDGGGSDVTSSSREAGISRPIRARTASDPTLPSTRPRT